jgi:hypothetical protein
LAGKLPRLLFLLRSQMLPGLNPVQPPLLLLGREAVEVLQAVFQALLLLRRQLADRSSMLSAGPLEIGLCAIATSRLHGSAGDVALGGPEDWRTGVAAVLPAAVGRSWVLMALAEPESADEPLPAAAAAGTKKPVPATAAVPGSGAAVLPVAAAACNLTLGAAREAGLRACAAVACMGNSDREAA